MLSLAVVAVTLVEEEADNIYHLVIVVFCLGLSHTNLDMLLVFGTNKIDLIDQFISMLYNVDSSKYLNFDLKSLKEVNTFDQVRITSYRDFIAVYRVSYRVYLYLP